MSVYIVASIAVEDWETYGRYQDGFLDVFAKYKGELLAVSDTPQVIEGQWPYTRAVILRFPDEAEARRWYEKARDAGNDDARERLATLGQQH